MLEGIAQAQARWMCTVEVSTMSRIAVCAAHAPIDLSTKEVYRGSETILHSETDLDSFTSGYVQSQKPGSKH